MWVLKLNKQEKNIVDIITFDETEDIEICPEFLNIRISEDGTDLPDINITAY